jgi:hypothetical protein
MSCSFQLCILIRLQACLFRQGSNATRSILQDSTKNNTQKITGIKCIQRRRATAAAAKLCILIHLQACHLGQGSNAARSIVKGSTQNIITCDAQGCSTVDADAHELQLPSYAASSTSRPASFDKEAMPRAASCKAKRHKVAVKLAQTNMTCSNQVVHLIPLQPCLLGQGSDATRSILQGGTSQHNKVEHSWRRRAPAAVAKAGSWILIHPRGCSVLIKQA